MYRCCAVCVGTYVYCLGTVVCTNVGTLHVGISIRRCSGPYLCVQYL